MSKSLQRLAPIIVMVAVVLPIVAYLYLGNFVRAVADDFCFSGSAKVYGLLGSVNHWYNTWSAHPSAIFVDGAIGLLQAWRFVPSTMIILWFAAIFWIIYQLAVTFSLRHSRIVTVGLSAALLFGIINSSANVYQTFYWISGISTYSIPTVLLLFNLGILLHVCRNNLVSHQRIAYVVLFSGVTMVATCFSPIYAAFQQVVLVLIGLVSLLPRLLLWRRTLLTFVGAGLVFGSIGLGIMMLSPGNAIHREQFDTTFTFIETVIVTLDGTLRFIPTVIGFVSLASLITPFIIFGAVAFLFHPLEARQRAYVSRNSLLWIGILTLVGMSLIGVCLFVTVFSINELPPPRAYLIPQLVLSIMAAAWGYIMGLGLQKGYAGKHNPTLARFGYVLMVAVLLFGPVQSAIKIFANGSTLSVFAHEWDLLDARLKQAALDNVPQVIIEPFTVDMSDLALVNKNRAQCLREHYGLNEVVVPQAADEG